MSSSGVKMTGGRWKSVGPSLLAITTAASSCSSAIGGLDARSGATLGDGGPDRQEAALQPEQRDGSPVARAEGRLDASVDSNPGDTSIVDVRTDVEGGNGWVLTVYYTSVQTFYGGAPERVFGCPTNQCASTTSDLGSYPAEFVQAVHQQGTGRVTQGTYAGQYLNWSIDVGYWLDVAPRDARGRPLEAYVSAAADPSVPYDLAFRVVDCGTDYFGSGPIAASVCAALRAATWVVRDRFTVGAVGAQLDLYIGEEDTPNFASTSPRLISAKNATVVFGP